MSNETYFDSESNMIKDLKRELQSLKVQLSVQKELLRSSKQGNLLFSDAIDYYPGEQLDFILSILTQAQKKCDPESRAYDILSSILSLNKPIGEGERILNEITKIFNKGYPKKESDILSLQALGFRYVTSKRHPKLKYQDKYIIVLSGTPSDNYHGSKNALKEIHKCLACTLKI